MKVAGQPGAVTPRKSPRTSVRASPRTKPNALVVLPPENAANLTSLVPTAKRPPKRSVTVQERMSRKASMLHAPLGMTVRHSMVPISQRDNEYRGSKDRAQASVNVMSGVDETKDETMSQAHMLRRVGSCRRRAIGQLEPDEDLTALSLTISKRYQLQFHEVKWILDVFKNAKTRPDGSMDRKLFEQFLTQVFDNSKIDEAVADEGYRTLDAGYGPIDLDLFFEWFRLNMFGVFAPLMADPKRRESDNMVRKLSKKYEISPVLVDKMKQKFDSFDVDGSEGIDFQEFVPMIAQLLGVQGKSDVPPDRLSRFWQEVDQDDSGAVSFEEFAEWYLKYFATKGQSNVVESFYSSYLPKAVQANPAYGRRKM